MQELSSQTIKGYQLRERLGTGGFGSVYKAFQPAVGRDVAIKIILPDLANQPDFIRRFETEAQVIARLEHPLIVPLYDYWRDPDGAYLVMRWLRGGSLSDLLKRGALDLETIARILEQVGSALALAHRNDIIHRDIKPGNILLDEDGNAYLADFGIAKDLKQTDGGGTQMDAIVGSLDYLSPEQARSEPVTSRTDIYSLGVVLYEMLTGQHPFPNMTSVERLYKHINDPLPTVVTSLEDFIQDAVNAVVQKATAKNPLQRYENVTELAAAFKEAAGLNRITSGSTMVELLRRREQEVLYLLVEGLSNKEIAQRLVVTLPTVKWYINELYRKLRVRSRVQAIVRARELNLIVSGKTLSEDATADASVMPDDLPQPENPYKGLRAFQVADERDFFGREDFIKKLLKRLTPPASLTKTDDDTHFLAVVGPSGSGKSSVVKAGLVPALLRGGVPGSERWFVVDMLPGAHPYDELEIALLKIAPGQIQIHDQLQRDERGLLRAVQLLLPADNSELVIVIDQFEEVFTLVEDETVRMRFLNLLRVAATEPRSRVHIVITLRADFYDRPLNYPEFGELLRSHMETLLPLSAKGIERAIVEPVKRAGITFEEGLIATIVGDVHYQAGALPLLQYALTELFELRNGRLITGDAYRAIGGAVGALAKRAEAIYLELDEAAQAITRQIFLRLVTLGEGVEDTRRRVARAELSAISSDPERLDEIMDTFAAYRLLALDHDPANRAPTVEVAHEALLREWERLRAWLNDSRNDIRFQRGLAAGAEEWEKAGRDESYLLMGMRLAQVATWSQATELALTPGERAFLSASVARHDRLAQAEAERQMREKVLERRSVRVLRALVTVLLLATLDAFGLTAAAVSSANEAQNARATSDANLEMANANFNRSEAQRLAAEATRLLAQHSNSDIIALLSVRSLQIQHSPQGDAAIEGAATLEYPRVVFTGHTKYVTSVVFSPDGKTILTGSDDSTARLWDAATGQELRVFSGHTDGLDRSDAVISPDGRYVLTGSIDKTARLWDINTGAVLHTLNAHSEWIVSVAFSPDSQLALTGSADNTARLWDVETGEEIRQFIGHTAIVWSVAFSPDGRYVLTGSDDATARLWDAATGQEIRQFIGHEAGLQNAAFSPDGALVATGSFDNSVRVWDVATGQELYQLTGQNESIRTVTFSPDGHYLLTTSGDGSAWLWDVATRTVLRKISAHTGSALGAAFSPDGQFFATSGFDNTARIWSLQATPELPILTHPAGEVWDAVYSPDGQYLLTGASDKTARLWDARTGQELRVFSGHTEGISFVAFSPDTRYVATTSWDKTARLWDIQTGAEIRRFTHTEKVNGGISFSHDGRYLLTGSDDALVHLWDVQNGQEVRQFAGHTRWLNGVVFSPDDNFIFSGANDGLGILWDAHTGEQVLQVEVKNQIWSIAYAPDGREVLTGDSTGQLQMWDAQTGELVRQFVGHADGLWGVAFSPDGRYVLSASQDKTARLWDRQTGQELRRFVGHTSVLESGVFSPDGRYVLTASPDGTARVWDVDYGTTIDYLCQHLARDFSNDEREQFDISDSTPTCSD